jgi:hypothetical protein
MLERCCEVLLGSATTSWLTLGSGWFRWEKSDLRDQVPSRFSWTATALSRSLSAASSRIPSMEAESFVLLSVENREILGVEPSHLNPEAAIVTVQNQGVYIYDVRRAF